ncbi:MAG: bifunctional glutamate N-acetyltransferase/amino-acid acetyltransferase ArgJ, partial [Elusimicrobiota bacterium]
MRFPAKFYINGIRCGILAKKNKRDLALFYSSKPCNAAGVFTRNLVKAAPVIISQKNLSKASSRIQAIIANSGCANACTGKKGLQNAEEMCGNLAKRLSLKRSQVLVASTGVIGTYLPMDKINKGIEEISKEIRQGNISTKNGIEAIMTTDTIPKEGRAQIRIDDTTCYIWGCAKGAGMIHPDMATLLCFILTDVSIDKGPLRVALKDAVNLTFNRISVDGDTSTNDTVLLLANGAAGNRKITSTFSPGYETFFKSLFGVCKKLAQMVAADGEGATKLIHIMVNSAPTEDAAKKIASTIATSPLVKTAVFGCDPNWGRIIAASGRSGVAINPDRIDIRINGIKVAKDGQAVKFSEQGLKESMSGKILEIGVELNSGKSS